MPEEIITPESKHIDIDPAPTSTQVGTMAQKLEAAMRETTKNQLPELKIDTTPKPLPEVKKEPLKETAKTTDTKPAKEAKKIDIEGEVTNPTPDHWKALKAARDEWKTKYETASKYEKEANDFKTQLEELRTKAPNPEEIDSLRKERQVLNDRLERIALEQSDRFKGHYDSRFEAAMEQALDAAGKDKSDQIKAILEAPKSVWRKAALNEIVTSMESEVDRLSLVAAVNEYDKTRTEREKQLADHKANLSRLKEVEEKKMLETKAQDDARRKEMAAQLRKKARETFEAFQDKEGDSEHNAAAAKAHKMIDDFIMGTMEDSVAVSLPMKAAEYDRLAKVTETQQAKIKELEEALASYKGAQPRQGEAKPGQQSNGEQKPMTYKERVLSLMREIPQPGT